jgi:hypothetical protein
MNNQLSQTDLAKKTLSEAIASRRAVLHRLGSSFPSVADVKAIREEERTFALLAEAERIILEASNYLRAYKSNGKISCVVSVRGCGEEILPVLREAIAGQWEITYGNVGYSDIVTITPLNP